MKEPEPIAIPTVLRRLLLWTAVCVVSAAPSFVIAAHQYHQGAMALGVVVFILIYTGLTSTAAFERFHRRPFVRRTLYIGYGTRMAISIIFPIAMFPDIVAGTLSISIVREIFRLEPSTFAGTFLTTCVSGTILNVMVLALMLVVYALQRALLPLPRDEQPRGFAVVMPVQSDDQPAVRAMPPG